MGVSGGAVFPPIQGAIADKFTTRTSYYLVVPAFAYIALWALWVWNKDGRIMTAGGSRKIEHEVEAAGGGTYPPAEVGLTYTGQQAGYYEGSVKEGIDEIEKV